jgi:hypothetical protein
MESADKVNCTHSRDGVVHANSDCQHRDTWPTRLRVWSRVPKRTDARIHWWVVAWVLVLAHYASNLLSPTNPFGQEVQASQSISTLALGAICFILSNVVAHETRSVTRGFAVGMMTMAMVCLNLIIFSPAPPWRLYIPFILHHVGIAVALQKNLRNRPRIFYALSTTSALGLLGILVILWVGKPEMLILRDLNGAVCLCRRRILA